MIRFLVSLLLLLWQLATVYGKGLERTDTPHPPLNDTNLPYNLWHPEWDWHWELADEKFWNNMSLVINITVYQPPKYARPVHMLNTILTLTLCIFTLYLNQFIRAYKDLRFCANKILLLMAKCECWSGLVAIPWSLYYLYVDFNPITEMDLFWCKSHQALWYHLPAMFNEAAVWLTCYLAYVRVLAVINRKRRYPSLILGEKTIIRGAYGICILAALYEIPKMFLKRLDNVHGQTGRVYCVQTYHSFLSSIYKPMLYTGFFYKLVTVHILPPLLLMIATILLNIALNRVGEKRSLIRRVNSANVSSDPNIPPTVSKMDAYSMVFVMRVIFFVLLLDMPITVLYGVIYTLRLPSDDSAWYHNVHLWFSQEESTVHGLMMFRTSLVLLTFPFNLMFYLWTSAVFRSRFWESRAGRALNVIRRTRAYIIIIGPISRANDRFCAALESLQCCKRELSETTPVEEPLVTMEIRNLDSDSQGAQPEDENSSNVINTVATVHAEDESNAVTEL